MSESFNPTHYPSMNTIGIMNLGAAELIVILTIILVLFGAKRLPGLARGMGQAIREFQKAKTSLART